MGSVKWVETHYWHTGLPWGRPLLRLYTAKYNYRTMNLAYHSVPISWNVLVVNTGFREQRHDTVIKTAIRQIKFLKTIFVERQNLRSLTRMIKKRSARKISCSKRVNPLTDYWYFRPTTHCTVTAYRTTVSWQCGRDPWPRNVSKVGYAVTLLACSVCWRYLAVASKGW